MAHKVKCVTCGHTFDRDEERCVKVGNRYRHFTCPPQAPIANDRKDLYDYIKVLENTPDTDWGRIGTVIERFKKEEHISYYDMLRTLRYLIEVKGQKYKGVGIIPYIYKEAINYYSQQEEMKLRAVEIAQATSSRPQESKTIELSISKPKKKYLELEIDS